MLNWYEKNSAELRNKCVVSDESVSSHQMISVATALTCRAEGSR